MGSYLNIDRGPSVIVKMLTATVGVIIFISLIIVVILPEILGDSLMEAGVTMVVNMVIATFHSMSLFGTIALPVSIGIVILSTVGYMEYQHYLFVTGSRWKLQKPLEVVDVEKEVEDMSMDLSSLAKLDEQMKKIKPDNWRKALKARLEDFTEDQKKAQDQKTLLDSVRSVSTFKEKKLPTMSSLVEKGILPDIFSPEPKELDTAEDVVPKSSVVRDSHVHQKYLRQSKVGVSPISPVDSMRELEQQWHAKAVSKRAADSTQFTRKQKEGFDDLGKQVLLRSRKENAIEKATSSLLSLFDKEADSNEGKNSDSEVDTEEMLERRRKRRLRRRKLQQQETELQAAGAGPTPVSAFASSNGSPLSIDLGGTSDDYSDSDSKFSQTPDMGKRSPPGLPPLDILAAKSSIGTSPPARAAPSAGGAGRLTRDALSALARSPVKLDGVPAKSEDSVKIRQARSSRAGNRFRLASRNSSQFRGVAREAKGSSPHSDSKTNSKKDEAEKKQTVSSEIAELFSSATQEGIDPLGFDFLHNAISSEESTKSRDRLRRHRSRKIKTRSLKDSDTDLASGESEKDNA